MTLLEKQQAFVPRVAALLQFAASLPGYALTFGETYRTPAQAAANAAAGIGIAHSLHSERLAIDLMVFVTGVYQTDAAAYAPLGEWWERQSTPDLTCCWGGRFTTVDADHFSIEHEGVK
jgi:hypothetical protein